jgi:hypothetical protein
MGEFQGTLFSPDFNRSLHVEACSERVSSDAGVLLLRERMDRLGYTTLLRQHLRDPRDQALVTHVFLELLRTALLLLAQGWSDHHEVRELGQDPLLRLAVSERRGDAALRPAEAREPDPRGHRRPRERGCGCA